MLLVTGILALVSPRAPVWAETNLNFVLGAKLLDPDDWPVGDNQGSIAFLSTFGPSSWPVQVAIDVLGSGSGSTAVFYPEPGVEVRGNELIHSTFELGVGVRKIWRTSNARPFVGGGLAVIWGQQEMEFIPLPDFDIDGHELYTFPPLVLSEDDEAPGVWIDGGIFWRLGTRFNIGLEARYSRAELSFRAREVQAGGFNLGLILGWGWGGGARIVP
jgi:hypothetical protein